MNNLVWKLLRQHISIGQLTGFFFANLFGMVIVLLSAQFYKDVVPIFTEGDSFMKKDYMTATKKISTLGSFAGKSNTFSSEEIEELKKQPFTRSVGAFTPSQFKVSAGLGMQEAGIHLSTEMFFEAVPDKFVDVSLDKWHFDENTHTIPIIIPRNYLNLYNFGFAQSRSLPKLSEGLMSLIQMDILMRGNGRVEQYKGNIVGFSNRLNTILVPQSFMNWANQNFAPDSQPDPSRLIIEVDNPADASIAKYFQQKGYETEDGKLDAGKTTYFLRLIVGIVLAVGLFISILSFYILMLSIYLLVQKNSSKLENLLLIGYSPNNVAKPYQVLTIALNIVVLTAALSVYNSCVYCNSRMLFGLAQEGVAPKAFAKLSKRAVPAKGLTFSCICLLGGVVMLYVNPSVIGAFTMITTVSAILFMFVWTIILCSYLVYRKQRPHLHEKSIYKMPLGKLMCWVCMAFFVFVVVLLTLEDDTRQALLVTPLWFIALGLGWLFIGKKRAAELRK